MVALPIEISIKFGSSKTKKSTPPLTLQRSFYLENNTAQTLSLQIPGVMNPNLPPFTRSGVDLPNGQPIYAKVNGEFYYSLPLLIPFPMVLVLIWLH